MKKIAIKINTFGYSDTDILHVTPSGITECGSCSDGVIFEHDHEGCWVVSLADLENIVLIAKAAASEYATERAP